MGTAASLPSHSHASTAPADRIFPDHVLSRFVSQDNNGSLSSLAGYFKLFLAMETSIPAFGTWRSLDHPTYLYLYSAVIAATKAEPWLASVATEIESADLLPATTPSNTLVEAVKSMLSLIDARISMQLRRLLTSAHGTVGETFPMVEVPWAIMRISIRKIMTHTANGAFVSPVTTYVIPIISFEEKIAALSELRPVVYTPWFQSPKPQDRLFVSTLNIVASLLFHPYGSLFEQRVNPERYRIADYGAVVVSPMDFGTVLHRLVEGHYARPVDCVSDLVLTLANCRLYNINPHQYHIVAAVLQVGLQSMIEMQFGSADHAMFSNFAASVPELQNLLMNTPAQAEAHAFLQAQPTLAQHQASHQHTHQHAHQHTQQHTHQHDHQQNQHHPSTSTTSTNPPTTSSSSSPSSSSHSHSSSKRGNSATVYYTLNRPLPREPLFSGVASAASESGVVDEADANVALTTNAYVDNWKLAHAVSVLCNTASDAVVLARSMTAPFHLADTLTAITFRLFQLRLPEMAVATPVSQIKAELASIILAAQRSVPLETLPVNFSIHWPQARASSVKIDALNHLLACIETVAHSPSFASSISHEGSIVSPASHFARAQSALLGSSLLRCFATQLSSSGSGLVTAWLEAVRGVELALSLTLLPKAINFRNWLGCTPLMRAASSSTAAVIEQLVTAGAKPICFSEKNYASSRQPISSALALPGGSTENLRALLTLSRTYVLALLSERCHTPPVVPMDTTEGSDVQVGSMRAPRASSPMRQPASHAPSSSPRTPSRSGRPQAISSNAASSTAPAAPSPAAKRPRSRSASPSPRSRSHSPVPASVPSSSTTAAASAPTAQAPVPAMTTDNLHSKRHVRLLTNDLQGLRASGRDAGRLVLHAERDRAILAVLSASFRSIVTRLTSKSAIQSLIFRLQQGIALLEAVTETKEFATVLQGALLDASRKWNIDAIAALLSCFHPHSASASKAGGAVPSSITAALPDNLPGSVYVEALNAAIRGFSVNSAARCQPGHMEIVALVDAALLDFMLPSPPATALPLSSNGSTSNPLSTTSSCARQRVEMSACSQAIVLLLRAANAGSESKSQLEQEVARLAATVTLDIRNPTMLKSLLTIGPVTCVDGWHLVGDLLPLYTQHPLSRVSAKMIRLILQFCHAYISAPPLIDSIFKWSPMLPRLYHLHKLLLETGERVVHRRDRQAAAAAAAAAANPTAHNSRRTAFAQSWPLSEQSWSFSTVSWQLSNTSTRMHHADPIIEDILGSNPPPAFGSAAGFDRNNGDPDLAPDDPFGEQVYKSFVNVSNAVHDVKFDGIWKSIRKLLVGLGVEVVADAAFEVYEVWRV
ncbi:hypothetical protein CAOG_08656, partial [Capsaspora owczarzaki ATCC 30864]